MEDSGESEAGAVFDEDKPSRTEAGALLSWMANAGYDVELCDTVGRFADALVADPETVVFPLWRGGPSRNRTAVVPALCEERGLICVGGDAFVQSACQDKSLSKTFAVAAGFDVPREWVIRSRAELRTFMPSRRLRLPVVVKPLLSGCSIGVTNESLCETDASARRRAKELFEHGLGPALCEEFVAGDEVALCLVERRGTVVASCAATYLDVAGRYPFRDRLFTFADKVLRHPPWSVALHPHPLAARIWGSARAVVRNLGPVNLLRIDGRTDGERFVVIELTPDIHLGLDSTFMGGFQAAGIPPHRLLDCIVRAAVENHRLAARG